MVIRSRPGCPNCGSLRVLRGRLSTFKGVFTFSGAKRLLLALDLTRLSLDLICPGITVAPESECCLDCGLLWTSIDPAHAMRTVRKWGTKELLLGLGLRKDKPATDRALE